jgi:hypothetical protein
MDEMRQLVRIMVKLIPSSLRLLNVESAGGGGSNHVSVEQINEYFRNTLGNECPQPEWGLPQGWGTYLACKAYKKAMLLLVHDTVHDCVALVLLAALFSWAIGEHISRADAMKTARRLPGRSWEAVEEELEKLGERDL